MKSLKRCLWGLVPAYFFVAFLKNVYRLFPEAQWYVLNGLAALMFVSFVFVICWLHGVLIENFGNYILKKRREWHES